MDTLTPQLQAAIVATVACGNAELKKLIEDELPLIYACLDVCNDRVRYYHTQLAAIELAQIFSRNKIDEANRNMAHTVTENYSARATRNTDGESTATGRSCRWAAATSQQNFVRDSTEDMTAWSEQNLLRTAERLEDGFDRSSRSTSGNGASFSLVTHIVDNAAGNALIGGAGQESRSSSRNSNTKGGTAPLLPLVGTNWPVDVVPSLLPPFVTTAEPGPFANINGPVNNPNAICPEPNPDHPDTLGLCVTNDAPYSAGQGVHSRFSLSIGIPPFSLSINWSVGFNQRQYFHCSGSRVEGSHTLRSVMDHLNESTTTALPEDNGSFSNETSSIIHFVRKNGSSTRRGTETVDAEERSNGYADGNSHSRSERNNQGNAFHQARAESLTVGHTTSTLRRTETLTDDEVRRSYGQISEHLAGLWKRIWEALQLLERQQGAVPYGGSMGCIPNALGCKDCTQYVPLLSRPQYRQATRIAL